MTFKKLIGQIEPIHKHPVVIKSWKDLKKLVELPLLDACLIFYDKNIQTISSTANKENIGEFAWINLDYDSLSQENKKIGEKLGRKAAIFGGQKIIHLEFPIEIDTKIETIHNIFVELASQFHQQNATWIPRYTLEQLEKSAYLTYGRPLKKSDLKEYVYDSQGKLYYLSLEHMKKAKKE